jgi:glycosyltransferase involved in cell wall biosynthesis
MKLLAVTNLFGRPWDPTVGTFNQKIFEQINSRCELTLLVPIAWTEIVKFPWQYIKAVSTQNRKWPYVRYFPYLYIPRISQSVNVYCLLISMIMFCPLIVFFHKWDAIIGSWIYPDSLAAVILARLRRKPSIAVALGTDVNDLINRNSQRVQVQRILSKCNATVTVSQDLANKLAVIGIDISKLHVILNGVDSDSFKPGNKAKSRQALGIKAEGKLILFVGSHIKEKGCFELIHAFDQISAKQPEYSLAMIGGGALANKLQELVLQLGLSTRVNFIGKLHHDKLPLWFACADAFCLPSYREGIPNVVMEALAAGLPVVATTVGGIPEVVDKGSGILVEPRDANALAIALQQALSQTWDTAAIVSSVKNYTWNATGEQYIQLIHGAIEKHQH